MVTSSALSVDTVAKVWGDSELGDNDTWLCLPISNVSILGLSGEPLYTKLAGTALIMDGDGPKWSFGEHGGGIRPHLPPKEILVPDSGYAKISRKEIAISSK